MDFLFINTQELSALMGLPYIHRVAYLLAIRPYMDRKTFVVGMKRRISYQSLSEALYVEPHQGIQSGSPSRQQLRRVVSGLERAGLVEIQSSDKHLILKCLLAHSDNSVPNKPDTNPTPPPGTKPYVKNTNRSASYAIKPQKPDISKTVKTDIPHNSDNYLFFLGEKFKKFWSLYPIKSDKQKTWETFKQLKPDDTLITQLFSALNQQIAAIEVQRTMGLWVPNWKNPVNWLQNRCWENEINLDITQENHHAINQKCNTAPRSVDSFWDSCKAGADYVMSDGNDDTDNSNVINLSGYQKTEKAH